MRRLVHSLRDLSLRGKVTLTLALVFALSATALLLVLTPVLAEQRRRLVDQEKTLLTTLRRSYEREFINDQLQQNREALALHLGQLASEGGIVWAQIEAGTLDLGATTERETILRLLGPDAQEFLDAPGAVLLVNRDGEADLVGEGGQPLIAGRKVKRERAPDRPAPPPGKDDFQETVFGGEPVLALVATLSAADEPYGRLHLLKSLAPLARSEKVTRGLFYGGVALSFVLVLLLLNLLLSQLVLGPVRRVNDAMARAATGDLSARLSVLSHDEVGRIAESFNRMVGELETSRREIEGYSRNLEAMVEERTGELRASQATLLALKNHLATVIANVGTGVLSLDEEGRIETFNERASEILDLPPEGARGHTLEEALGGAPTNRLVEAVAVVRDGRRERYEAQLACRLPKGPRTLSVVASVLRGEGQRPIGTVVVIEDLTEILATQRLTAWKEAVERVIHEIKNPLTPVALAAETLRTAWAREPERFADLFPGAIDMILGAVRDLRNLIGEFSRFSRLPPPRPERVDPNALVVDTVAPYTSAPPRGIEVRLDLAPQIPEVEVDADQLKRVLLNVVNNALEAMGEGGGCLRLRTAPEDGGVTIRVEDDGPGVEDVQRIFEPHYTTKVKGTGLGLAIARQIVEEHGGAIGAESAPGKGTSVRIHLPAAAPRPATA